MGWRASRGFILITSIYVLVIVSILSLSLTARSLAETMTARQYSWSDTAFHLADAALDATMSNFRRDDFNEWISAPPDWDYSAEVIRLPALEPIFGEPVYQIIGHGAKESLTRHVEAIVDVTPFSVFPGPLFADQRLDLRGTVDTDSYDSSLGGYGECLSDCTSANPVVNIRDNGDIGTNAITNVQLPGPTNDVGIFISGDVDVNGDILVGEGGDPADVMDTNGGSYTVSGTTSARSDPLLMPPVIVPAGLTCTNKTIASFDTLTLDPTLGPREYCYHNLTIGTPDALNAIGPAVLEVTGEVTIYITGELKASNQSFIGNASHPSYTVIQLASPQYQGGLTTDAELTGGTQFYGAIYAPDSTVNLHGMVDIYGAITANAIWQTGTAGVHYDERLLEERDDLPTGGYATEVIYWRDRDLSE